MKNLVKHVQNINARHKLWVDGDTLIIGVSGGPDSMCLFDVMVKIAKKRNLKIIAAHVNYGLRGDASDSDQRVVEEYAQKENVVTQILRYKGGASDENMLRKARYDFFAKLLDEYSAKGVLIAHSKNDQAETLLLHLLRGSGLQGLSGMRVYSERYIMRPLLFTSREDILEYLKKNNINYNIDESNNKNVFTRNKIRNNLIPYLENEFNPNIIDTLAKTAQIVAQDYDFLEECSEEFWNYNKKKNTIIFSAKEFVKLHNSQQQNSLRAMILQVNNNTIDIESGFIEEMQKMILSNKNKRQKITGKNLKMLRYGDIVELTCLQKNK